jgi:hypothetical protein
MATLITAWRNHVLSQAAGVLAAYADQKVLDALVDFCTRSLIWLDDHTPLDSVANQGAYAYAPAANTAIVKPALVWFNGNPLTPKNKDELAQLYKKWPSEVGTPLYCLGQTPDKITLVPAPVDVIVGGLTMKVHLKPSRAAVNVPDWIYEDYQEAIAAGALARLKSQSNRPYSDPRGAVDCQGYFDDQVAIAKERALKALGRARPKVVPQFF